MTLSMGSRYAEQHAHYLADGVDFWWNDEGETYYFAFYYWNLAQVSLRLLLLRLLLLEPCTS